MKRKKKQTKINTVPGEPIIGCKMFGKQKQIANTTSSGQTKISIKNHETKGDQ